MVPPEEWDLLMRLLRSWFFIRHILRYVGPGVTPGLTINDHYSSSWVPFSGALCPERLTMALRSLAK